MALTEQEKRKLLRERRAAKISNGSARLNKITGDVPAAEDVKPEVKPDNGIKDTIHQDSLGELPHVSREKKTSKSNRISQNFSDDPPVQDIDSVEMQAQAKELQRSLQELIGSVKHEHAQVGNEDSKELEMMFSSMMNGVPKEAGGKQHEEDVDVDFEKIVEAKKANDKFKAQVMALRMALTIAVTLYFYFTYGFKSSTLSIVTGDFTPFIQVFTAFEVIATSAYAIHMINTPEKHYNYNSKILEYLGFVPEQLLSLQWKQRIKLGIKYMELLQLSLFDLSTVVVVFGLLSVLH